MDVSKEIKTRRKARGWTQQQLAEAAGIGATTVFSVENGRPARPAILRSIARALGLPDDHLLEDRAPEQTQRVLHLEIALPDGVRLTDEEFEAIVERASQFVHNCADLVLRLRKQS